MLYTEPGLPKQLFSSTASVSDPTSRSSRDDGMGSSVQRLLLGPTSAGVRSLLQLGPPSSEFRFLTSRVAYSCRDLVAIRMVLLLLLCKVMKSQPLNMLKHCSKIQIETEWKVSKI